MAALESTAVLWPSASVQPHVGCGWDGGQHWGGFCSGTEFPDSGSSFVTGFVTCLKRAWPLVPTCVK